MQINRTSVEELSNPLKDAIKAVREMGSPNVGVIALIKVVVALFKMEEEDPSYVERALQLLPYVFDMIRSNQLPIEENQIEELITFIGAKLFDTKDYDKMIDLFGKIELPFAAYFSHLSFLRLMGDSETPKKKRPNLDEKQKFHFKRTIELLKTAASDHPLKFVLNVYNQELAPSNVHMLTQCEFKMGYVYI